MNYEFKNYKINKRRKNFNILSSVSCYLLSVSWLLIPGAQAALVRPLNDLKVIEVPVSQTGLTRITVKGDRIANVFGVAGEYVMEPDEDRGQVFIRPLEPALNPISLTLTTEGGHTQDLRLVLKDQAPEALILKAEQNSGEIVQESITRNEIEDLLYACAEGRIPVGYLSVSLETPNAHELHHLVREIENNKLRGLTYEVKNLATIPWILAESGFAETLDIEVVAILMPKKILQPGEKAYVYVAAKSI